MSCYIHYCNINNYHMNSFGGPIWENSSLMCLESGIHNYPTQFIRPAMISTCYHKKETEGFTWSAWLEVRDRVRRRTVHNVVLHLNWSCGDSSRQGFYTSSKAIENVGGEGLLLWKRRCGKTASSWITLIAWLNVRIDMSPSHVHSHSVKRENLYLTVNLLSPAAGFSALET